jgi:glycerol-3-phosphate acyltransferase PlsY
MLWTITAVLISYLVGSIPTAYIFGMVLKGVDIRKFGSGNVGATNALRLLGKTAGITVLILDILKGFLAVFVLGGLLKNKVIFAQDLFLIALGVAAICGHNWTVFLNFKGGKGIATTFGVLIAFAFNIPGLNLILGLTILTWIVSFLIIRVVSFSSVTAAISLPIYMALFKQPRLMLYTAILLSVFVILRHKSNLVRLLKGEEKRLNFSKKPKN